MTILEVGRFLKVVVLTSVKKSNQAHGKLVKFTQR